MASLNKLLIQGIRSFDPGNHEVIEFFPMTVIVGHNGSGKTVRIAEYVQVNTILRWSGA
jgi:DNA repair protein RAD50